MRILLLGATGQVGAEVARACAGGAELLAPGRGEADLARPEMLAPLVQRTAPEVIVNAAAWTAVDRAESDREGAFTVNAVAPGVLARAAAERGALFIHYSTDYVFGGVSDRPWREEDPTAPLNVYGESKLEGERQVREAGGEHLILRTSWVYGPRGQNFLLTMRRLFGEREEVRVVHDQLGAPTTARHLARATAAIIGRGRSGDRGLFHVTAGGVASWYDFAVAIHQRLARRGPLRTTRIVPIRSEEFPTPARRPRYSVLDSSRFAAAYGVVAPSWTDLLDETIAELGED